MSQREAMFGLNPLSIVESWKDVPGTVSNFAATASARSGAEKVKANRPTSHQNLFAYAEALPPEEREAVLAAARAKRIERADRAARRAALAGTFRRVL